MSKIPNMMKRNARYRGQRESEKYISDHQEELYDIRQNHKDISELTELQNARISSWFHGNLHDPVENITYSEEKTFNATLNQHSYALVPNASRSQFSVLVVELNGTILSPDAYDISNGFLVISSNALQAGVLKIQYTVTVPVQSQRMVGLDENHKRLQDLNDRMGALERRYQSYENAYK